jgi:hypothetical protein
VAALKKTIRRLLRYVPKHWRHEYYRQQLRLPVQPSAELTVRIARSQQELEAAFKLLHDAYVSEGFMQPHPSGLRVTPYHGLPSTTTLIAVWNEEIVGTASIIRDNVFGLPMDKGFDLSDYRRMGTIAEVSSLAIKKEFRSQGGEVLFPLCKYIWEYCRHFMRVDRMVITVNPSRIDFYEALLQFELVNGGRIERYPFANNAPAIGAVMNIEKSVQDYARVYAGAEDSQSMHYYFVRLALSNLQFPDRPLFKVSDPVMTPELLHYFFNIRTAVFSTLSTHESRRLKAVYGSEAYKEVIEHHRSTTSVLFPAQRSVRFEMDCESKIISGNSILATARVIEISESGLRIQSDFPLETLPHQFQVQILIGNGRTAEVLATLVWKRSNQAGLKIYSCGHDWLDALRYLKEDRVRVKQRLTG